MATEVLYPNGAGDRTECTPDVAPNWSRVCEDPADDGASMVATSVATSPDEDLYTIPAPSDIEALDIINSVTVYARSSAGVMGTGTVAPCVKEGGTDTAGTPQNLSGWGEHSETWNTRPSNGANWAYSDLVGDGALQIGHRLTASAAGVSTTRVKVVIDYTKREAQVIIVGPVPA